jgi:hypothetical protein
MHQCVFGTGLGLSYLSPHPAVCVLSAEEEPPAEVSLRQDDARHAEDVDDGVQLKKKII